MKQHKIENKKLVRINVTLIADEVIGRNRRDIISQYREQCLIARGCTYIFCSKNNTTERL